MNENSLLDKFQARGSYGLMSSEPKMTRAPQKPHEADRKPVWAEGLKRMYDSVVDEQIPDEFVELLKKLDDASDKS